MRMRSQDFARCKTCPVPPRPRGIFKRVDCRRAQDTGKSWNECSGESQAAESGISAIRVTPVERWREVMRPLLHKKLGGKLRKLAFNTLLRTP